MFCIRTFSTFFVFGGPRRWTGASPVGRPARRPAAPAGGGMAPRARHSNMAVWRRADSEFLTTETSGSSLRGVHVLPVRDRTPVRSTRPVRLRGSVDLPRRGAFGSGGRDSIPSGPDCERHPDTVRGFSASATEAGARGPRGVSI